MAREKLPWIRFWPKDWNYDMRLYSAPFRGVWISILCAIWELGEGGSLTTTEKDLRKWCAIDRRTFGYYFRQILDKNVADFRQNGDGTFTITSRRMARDLHLREQQRKWKKKSRAKSGLSQGAEAERPIKRFIESVQPKAKHSPEQVANAKKVFGMMAGAWERYLGEEYKPQAKDWKQIYQLMKLVPPPRIKQMIDLAFTVVNNPDPRGRWMQEVTFQSLLHKHKKLLTELRRIEKEEDDVL